MLLELIGAFFIFIIVLIVIAEYSQKLSLGAIVSVLIIPLALWILVDGVQITTGETTISVQETNVTRGCCEYAQAPVVTDVTSSIINETTIYTYSEVEATPGLLLNTVLGITGICLGIFGLFHYVLRIMDTK